MPLMGELVMDGVDFGYTPAKQILHDIRLYALPGQKIAFVGATGAGKTTITNLINRFYDIDEGKIRYDGINITKIKKPELRRSLGMVLQDPHLFTVRSWTTSGMAAWTPRTRSAYVQQSSSLRTTSSSAFPMATTR
jgi:ABC-type multidrug transport system fused ATPase/permease subunit